MLMAGDFHKLPIRWPAKFDYGSRRGYPTKALVFHMAEGLNVARYLSTGSVSRGVSVHYTIEQGGDFQDGQIVRILPEDRISGSINPDTIRRTNDNGKPIDYGVKHNRHALGSYWTNPNVAVITVEVAGRALEGPTAKQVDAMVELFEDVDRRYGRVIPLGHRDFQSVKPCPGQKPAMRQAFARMGGHGADFGKSQPERHYMSTRGFVPGTVCDVADGARLFDYPGGKAIATVDGDLTRYLLGYSPNGRDYALITSEYKGSNRTAWVKAGQIANPRVPESPSPTNCVPLIENARAAAHEAAHVASIEWHEKRRGVGP